MQIRQNGTTSLGSGEVRCTALGALHVIEHSLRAVLPTEMYCNRRGVRGLSTPAHPDAKCSTILLYDVWLPGVGQVRGGDEHIEEVLTMTWRRLATCPCQAGCPAYIHLPN